MKRFFLSLFLILSVLVLSAQLTPVNAYRIADNVTNFGRTVSAGTIIFDAAEDIPYIATATLPSTSSINNSSECVPLNSVASLGNWTFLASEMSVDGSPFAEQQVDGNGHSGIMLIDGSLDWIGVQGDFSSQGEAEILGGINSGRAVRIGDAYRYKSGKYVAGDLYTVESPGDTSLYYYDGVNSVKLNSEASGTGIFFQKDSHAVYPLGIDPTGRTDSSTNVSSLYIESSIDNSNVPDYTLGWNSTSKKVVAVHLGILPLSAYGMTSGGSDVANGTIFRNAIADGNTGFFIDDNYSIDKAVVPSNVKLYFHPGYSLDVTDTLFLTETEIDAGRQRIFSDQTVISGTVSNAEVYPEWFGAVGDSVTESAAAIQKTLDWLGGVVRLKGGKYILEDSLHIPKGVFFSLNPRTILENSATMHKPLVTWTQDPVWMEGGILQVKHFDEMLPQTYGDYKDSYTNWMMVGKMNRSSYNGSDGVGTASEDLDFRLPSRFSNITMRYKKNPGERTIYLRDYMPNGIKIHSDTAIVTSLEPYRNYRVENFNVLDTFSNFYGTGGTHGTDGYMFRTDDGTIPTNWSHGSIVRKVDNASYHTQFDNVTVTNIGQALYMQGDPYSGMINSYFFNGFNADNNYKGIELGNRSEGHVFTGLHLQPKNSGFGIKSAQNQDYYCDIQSINWSDSTVTLYLDETDRTTEFKDGELLKFYPGGYEYGYVDGDSYLVGSKTTFKVRNWRVYDLDTVGVYTGVTVLLQKEPLLQIHGDYNVFSGNMAWDLWSEKSIVLESGSSYNECGRFGVDRSWRFILDKNPYPTSNKFIPFIRTVAPAYGELHTDLPLRIKTDGNYYLELHHDHYSLGVSGRIAFFPPNRGGLDNSWSYGIDYDTVALINLGYHGTSFRKPAYFQSGAFLADYAEDDNYYKVVNDYRMKDTLGETLTYPFTLFVKGKHTTTSYVSHLLSVASSTGGNYCASIVLNGDNVQAYLRDASNTDDHAFYTPRSYQAGTGPSPQPYEFEIGQEYVIGIVFLNDSTRTFYVNGYVDTQVTDDIIASPMGYLDMVHLFSNREGYTPKSVTQISRAVVVNRKLNGNEIATLASSGSIPGCLADYGMTKFPNYWKDDTGNGDGAFVVAGSAETATIIDEETLRLSDDLEVSGNVSHSGALTQSHADITASATLGDYYYVYCDDGGQAAITVTLPTGSAYNGRSYYIINKGQGNVTIAAASGTLTGGSATLTTANGVICHNTGDAAWFIQTTR